MDYKIQMLAPSSSVLFAPDTPLTVSVRRATGGPRRGATSGEGRKS